MKEHFSAKIKLYFDKKREKGLKIVLMMRIVGCIEIILGPVIF